MSQREFEISMIDTLGGLRLEKMTLREWVCPDPLVKHLDLWDAPHLEKLDLSRCQPGMHLVLVGCPQLREVILPQGEPCNLHLDHPHPPRIHFHGSIEALDACWPGQQFRVQTSIETPWNHAWIAPAEKIHELESEKNAEVLVVHGKAPATTTHLQLDQCKQLLWLQAEELEALTLGSNPPEHLEKLQIYQASTLREFICQPFLADLEVRQAGQLGSIQGPIRQVQLSDGSGAEKLTLSGEINALRMQHSKTRDLDAQSVDELEVNFCGHLKATQLQPGCEVTCQGPVPAPLRRTARIFVNEATVKELVKEFHDGQQQALDDLQPLMTQMISAVQIPRALWMLHELLQAGADPAWVWQTRMELSARHLRAQRKRKPVLATAELTDSQLQNARQQWRWRLPSDLNENAWLDDWRIWRHCLAVPEARDYTKVISKRLIDAEAGSRSNEHPMEISGWIRHWLNAGDLQLPQVQKILRHLLKSLAKKHKVWHLHLFNNDLHHLPLQLLQQVNNQVQNLGGDTQPLKDALLDYESRTLSVKDLLQRLQRLMQDEPITARQQLIQLAAKGSEFMQGRGTPEEVANFPRQARALALSGG